MYWSTIPNASGIACTDAYTAVTQVSFLSSHAAKSSLYSCLTAAAALFGGRAGLFLSPSDSAFPH